MTLANYVNINITTQSTAVSQQGFGTILILGPNATFTGTRTYMDLTGVLADFATSTAEYKAAAAAFGASPKPDRIKIGKANAIVAGAGNVTLGVAPITGNVIALTVNGQAVSVTYATSSAATMTALAAAIAAVTGIASATVNGTNPDQVDITGTPGYSLSLGSATVSGGASQPTITPTIATPSVTLADSLASIQLTDDDWYGLAITDNSAANILNVAAWVEAQTKIFGVDSQDANILTTSTTDIASQLKAKGYNRTHLLYHATAGESPAIVWMAEELAIPPGSATWMFKALPGVTVDTLTSSQYQNAKGKNCNIYTAQAGVSMTEEGKMGGGQYIDIVVGNDWLQSTMTTDIFVLLVNSRKIPYTDKGAAVLENIVRKRLKMAVDQGILADDGAISVTVPRVADQAANDRANRYFPGLKFSANLAGAVHKVGISGTVSV